MTLGSLATDRSVIEATSISVRKCHRAVDLRRIYFGCISEYVVAKHHIGENYQRDDAEADKVKLFEHLCSPYSYLTMPTFRRSDRIQLVRYLVRQRRTSREPTATLLTAVQI